MSDPEDLIERSWEDNADAWIRAVRLGTIASRALTDRAMLDAIISIGPSKVLDLGCGEGWLTRELGARGIAALGVDRSKALIEQARRGPGDFRQLSYDQIDAHWQVLSAGTPIDLVACHFSLLGESSTEQAVAAIGRQLPPQGVLLIQTLHPFALLLAEDGDYHSGWREGTWADVEGDFSTPAPWYFRTLSDWSRLLADHGFALSAIGEPRSERQSSPCSLLLQAHRLSR